MLIRSAIMIIMVISVFKPKSVVRLNYPMSSI